MVPRDKEVDGRNGGCITGQKDSQKNDTKL